MEKDEQPFPRGSGSGSGSGLASPMDNIKPDDSLSSPISSSATSFASYTTAESISESDSDTDVKLPVNEGDAHEYNSEYDYDHEADYPQAQTQTQDDIPDPTSDEHLIRAPRLAHATLPVKYQAQLPEIMYEDQVQEYIVEDADETPRNPTVFVRASSAPPNSLHDAPGSSISSSSATSSFMDMDVDMYKTPETTDEISCRQNHGGLCSTSVDCPNCHFVQPYAGSRDVVPYNEPGFPMGQRFACTLDFTNEADLVADAQDRDSDNGDGIDGQDADNGSVYDFSNNAQHDFDLATAYTVPYRQVSIEDHYDFDNVLVPNPYAQVDVENGEHGVDTPEHGESVDEEPTAEIKTFSDTNQDNTDQESSSDDSTSTTDGEAEDKDMSNDNVSVSASVGVNDADDADDSDASSSDDTASSNDSEEEDSDVSSASSSDADSDAETTSTAPTSEGSSTVYDHSSDDEKMLARKSANSTTLAKPSDQLPPSQGVPASAVAVQADSQVLEFVTANTDKPKDKDETEPETETHNPTEVKVVPAPSKKRRADTQDSDNPNPSPQPVGQRRRLALGDYLPAFAVGTAFGAVGTVFGLMQMAPQ